MKVDGAGAVVLPRLPVKKSTPSKETLEQNSAPPVEDDELVQAIKECAGSRTGRLPGFERWLLSLTEGERSPILRNITSRTAAKRLWNAYKKKRARECEADPLPQGAEKNTGQTRRPPLRPGSGGVGRGVLSVEKKHAFNVFLKK